MGYRLWACIKNGLRWSFVKTLLLPTGPGNKIIWVLSILMRNCKFRQSNREIKPYWVAELLKTSVLQRHILHPTCTILWCFSKLAHPTMVCKAPPLMPNIAGEAWIGNRMFWRGKTFPIAFFPDCLSPFQQPPSQQDLFRGKYFQSLFCGWP